MKRTARVRVRFAPTPTENLHVAKLRAALINWLFARKSGGVSVLRIDDLDHSAQGHGFESIVEDLHWLGLDYDEGANKKGGLYGPYFQSQRSHIYQPYIQKLIDEKSAYRCFCLSKGREGRREEWPFSCGSKCYLLKDNETGARMHDKCPYVVRLRATAGDIMFSDIVQGRIVFKGESLGDFIFASSDGSIAPEFASAIDDCLMMISHVIRGEGFVSRTPRQILLCRALEFEPPIFGHLTPIADMDDVPMRTDTDFVTVNWLRKEGYFPEAILGFVARLAGMVVPAAQRPTLDNLLANFDITKVVTPAPQYDLNFLKSENERQIKALEPDELVEYSIPFLLRVGFSENDSRIPRVVALYADSVQHLSELARRTSIFVKNSVPLSDKASSLIRKDSSQKVLWSFKRELEVVRKLDAAAFRRIMSSVKQETGILGSDLWGPVRVALSGEADGPDLPQVAELLGRDKCLKFVSAVLGS